MQLSLQKMIVIVFASFFVLFCTEIMILFIGGEFMERPIVKDILFLKRKSAPATEADLGTVKDLADTLAANRGICAGLAANMIGVSRRIIIAATPLAPLIMLNPVIVSHSEESYFAEEGCLSLTGTRKVRRYERIEVEYQDTGFKKHKASFSGFTAQIIQHETDHLDGIII